MFGKITKMLHLRVERLITRRKPKTKTYNDVEGIFVWLSRRKTEEEDQSLPLHECENETKQKQYFEANLRPKEN